MRMENEKYSTIQKCLYWYNTDSVPIPFLIPPLVPVMCSLNKPLKGVNTSRDAKQIVNS